MISLVIADDHEIVRKGFTRWLGQFEDIRVLAEADSGHQAVRLVGELNPDVLVLDVCMPGRDGLDVAKDVTTRYPTTRILVLTCHEDAYIAQRAFRAGARGFVQKSAALDEILAAVRSIAVGQRFIPRELEALFAQRYLGGVGDRDPLDVVTDREFQVLRFLAEGMSNREIATKLAISVRTVDGHRHNLLRKLQLRNNADLTRFAIRCGLVAA